MGILKKMAEPKQLKLKPEMGPPKSSIWVIDPVQRPVLLAEFNKSNEPQFKDKWDIYGEAWDAMNRMHDATWSLPDFKAELSRE